MSGLQISEELVFDTARRMGDKTLRAEYVEQVCLSHPAIKARVLELLALHDEEVSLFDRPAGGLPQTLIAEQVSESAGTQIGPYKLLQKIGEGGMGVVYMAEQSKPVERRVALKIIKPGMDTKQVIARFEAERQALAMMDHPNIAKVLDAGETASGRPYFVMELVKGVPITEYCDEHHASPKQRLELFLSVLHAVQHAHQKGIIHRDLKPSNVLVAEYDDRAVPKVIDFGVAKATSQKLTDKTMFTQYGQLVGTFEYMSPEQSKLNQMDIDTRSDVYSLGVLLYELLAGDTPFDRQRLRSAAFEELLRIIREEEPPLPSTRLNSSATLAKVSANRSMEPKRLSTLIRGELDWIVMKAMDKNRNRRYETASAFAADVERHLHNEPVEACPPSALYRFRKFVSHHRVAFTTGSLVTAAVLVGLITSVSLAVRADRERRRAEAAFVEAEASRKSELEQRQAVSKERDEAQRQRDQVTGLNQTLRDHQEQQRRVAYTRDMRLVQASWNAGNVDQVRELLASHRAKPDEQDLRGFEWHYWNRQANAESRTFQIPRGNARVISAAISSDGSRIAQVVNSQVTIWSVEAGRPLRTITLPTLARWYQTQFLGASEKRLAIAWDIAYSGAFMSTLQVFDVDTGKSLYSIHEPLGLLATSPDGSRLAAIVRAEGNSKWALKIWDADTGNVLIENPLADYPNEIAVGPQATRIAMSYNEPSRVEIMTPDQSSEIITLGLDKPVSSLSLMQFSADGTRLAISQSDGFGGIEYSADIVVYDLSDPNEIRPPQVFRDGFGFGLALSADGRYLAYGLPDTAAIQIVSLSDGRPLATLYGHARGVRHVAFSSDAKRLISADAVGTVREWKLPAATNWNVGSIPDMLALAPDQSRIAVVPSATSVTSSSEENVPTANRVTVLGLQGQGTLLLPPLDGPITQGGLSFSKDGQRLAVAAVASDRKLTEASDVRVFDTSSGRGLLSLRLPGRRVGSTHTHACPIAISPDGKRLAVRDTRQSNPTMSPLRMLDIDTQQEIQLTEEVPFDAWSLQWSPNGRWIAAGSHHFSYPVSQALSTRSSANWVAGSIAVWDAETGRVVCQLKPDVGGNQRVQFSPDGDWMLGAIFPTSWLVAATSSRSVAATSIRIWETNTGKVLYTLQIPAGINFHYFGTLAISSDLRQIAIAGSSDRTQAGFIVVWDLQKPEHPQILKGHVGRIRTLEFSPDASRLVSSSLSQKTHQTKLWDVGTGEELLSDNTGQFIMKFSDKGRELLGIRAKDDGEISITRWDSSPPLLMVEAQHLVASIMNRIQTELPTTSELVANIQADTSLPHELREAAVTALWQWPRQTELLQAAWSRLSLTQPTSQDLERALAYLADARASDPVNKSAWLGSAVAYHRLNRPTDAQAALNQYRQSLVQSPEPHMTDDEQIQAFLSEFPFQPSGQQDQATGIAEMTSIIAVDPTWSVPYFARASRQSATGDYRAALESLNTGLRLEPQSIWGINARAWLLATCPDRLVRNGEQAVADTLRLANSTAASHPKHLDTLAAALAQKGDFEAAIKQQELALSHVSPVDKEEYHLRLQLYRHRQPYRELPSYWYQRSNEAQSRFDIAGDLRSHGELDAALKEYQAAIEVNTTDFWAAPYLRRAEILFEQNKLEEAHSEFRKFIEFAPSNLFAHNELGRILLVQEKLDEAADQFRLTIDLKPDYARAHHNLGITLQRQGKLPEALAAHRIAIQLEPDLASHHNGLAWLLVTGRDANGGFLNVEEGLREAQRSCELAPNNGNSQSTLGVAYYRNKQWQLAIDALKKSIELGNDDIFNWLFLAMAEARLNRQDQARAWYDKALTWSESNELDTEERSFFTEASAILEADKPKSGTADKEQADPEF